MKLQRSPTRSKRLSSLCGSVLTPFSFSHYNKTSLGLVFHNLCVRFVRSFYTTGEEVQTYPTGVSSVASGVTHDTTYVIFMGWLVG
jgi:hypothetical protein